MNLDQIKVMHLPARTPFARLLSSNKIIVVNGKKIPKDLSFLWLDSNLNKENLWEEFDVLHIHSIELAPIDLIERVCIKIKEKKKGIVFTIHDTVPMFNNNLETFYHLHNTLRWVQFKLSLCSHGVVEWFDLLSNQFPSLTHPAHPQI